MKKLIINENWEDELVEDLDQVLALAYRQGPDNGYVLNYGGDQEDLKSYYNDAVASLEDMNAEEDTKVYLVLLPNTSQVKALLDLAAYNGTNATSTNREATDSLLIYPDCEVLECWQGEPLTEAKKKKKRKKRKTPRVTYTTGWPWYNDHMFNHHIGSCDCNKNKDEAGEDAADNANDAIGGGESVGDAGSAGGDFGGDIGGGEGGAMGESLVTEAMTPLEKMQALENGTRGFNAAAASDQKLWDNLLICAKNNLVNAGAVIVAEIKKRINQNVWSLGPIPGLSNIPTTNNTQPNVSQSNSTTQTQATPDEIILNPVDFWASDMRVIKQHQDDPDAVVTILKRSKSIVPAIAIVILASVAGLTKIAEAVKEYVLTKISKQELKKIINDCKSNTKIVDKITTICNETLNEGANKMSNLTEAKRYIKRYYIRPQNVFASNKSEILQRLAEVEADGANCSIYSLKALDDHDDVHLLQPKDIIYYYDNGVLYDKNHVPVLDYDLNVKNEEERPKISAEATSDERFKDVYQDRMTDRTIAESLTEDLGDFNVFSLDFTDINAFGIKLTEGKEAEYTCCICGEEFEGYGNNPAPVKESGKCCDACNRKFVIPARLNIEVED